MALRKRLTTLWLAMAFTLVLGLIPGQRLVSQSADEPIPIIDTSFYSYGSFSCKIDPIPDLTANPQYIRAGLLYDVDEGKIVWHKNMETVYPIASLTKMMVGLLVMEDIAAGKLAWDSLITVTQEATMTGGSRVLLRKGEQYTIRQLLAFSMVVSGNDACYLLAQALGNGERNFVYRMRDRADSLGMSQTCFYNSTGMPIIPGDTISFDQDNYSSARDLLLLSMEILKHPELVEISSHPEETVHHRYRKQVFRNHNSLAVQYKGEIDGIKTGWTNNAGCCVVASARRCDRRLISIALGAKKSSTRNIFVAGLVSNYYKHLGLGALGQAIKDTTLLAQGDSTAPAVVKEQPKKQPSGPTYTVKQGDNLFAISKRFGCTIYELKKWNNLTSSTITAGQKLKVKAPSENEPVLAAKPANPATKPPVASGSMASPKKLVYHVVQPGDTLWNIARRYEGVTVEQLKRINRISNARSLVPGMKLKILVT